MLIMILKISCRWNLLSNEHLNYYRPHLPSLKYINWRLLSLENNLVMIIPNGYDRYFGVNKFKSKNLSSGYTKARFVHIIILIKEFCH